jgi:glycerophosphoryl diester phosphodiesterase
MGPMAFMRLFGFRWHCGRGLTRGLAAIVLLTFWGSVAASATKSAPRVFMQAHRGGMDEVPENTLLALEHAWSVPGAVPEVDLRTTRDGEIVCMHDPTPARTTTAPEPWAGRDLRRILLEQLRRWDAGAHFAPRFAGTPVPTLDEVFDAMADRPERRIYLDLKDVDLDDLEARITVRGLIDRILFVHGDPEFCLELQARFAGVRTMTWLSGPPLLVKRRFEELAAHGFPGLSQLQFHLQPAAEPGENAYLIEWDYLEMAVERTRAAGVELQVRPFVFDPPLLRRLIDMGIHWYVTDAPKAFYDAATQAVSPRGRNGRNVSESTAQRTDDGLEPRLAPQSVVFGGPFR